jgi:hypothetical protein
MRKKALKQKTMNFEEFFNLVLNYVKDKGNSVLTSKEFKKLLRRSLK